MKSIKSTTLSILAVVLLSIVGIVGVASAADCAPVPPVDPGTLPFPVNVELIHNRLLGGVVLTSETPYSIELSACDSPGDPLVFTVTNIPNGMTFDAETNTLSWTPGTEDAGGTFYVDVEVADQPESNPANPYAPGTPSLSDKGTIVFKVYRANTAPILLAIPHGSS